MISLSLVFTIFLGYPVFAMDDRERNLEITHQARLGEAHPDQKEQQSEIPSTLGRHVSRHPSANKSSHTPKYASIDDLDCLESKQDQVEEKVADQSTSNDSFDTVVFGNQDIIYSNWLLEKYAKNSFMCWGFIYSIFGDLDSISHAAETALTVCTQYVKGDIAVYVIEVTMIADTLHQLYSLSQKILPIRAKQARMYEKQNKLNAALDPERPLMIDGKNISENSDYYASSCNACCYNFCATYRNIAWEQMGILAILCRVLGNSIVAFSLTSNSNTYLFAATLLRIGGTFSLIYAKSLSKNTKEMEQKAIDSANYIEYKKRLKRNAKGSLSTSDIGIMV